MSVSAGRVCVIIYRGMEVGDRCCRIGMSEISKDREGKREGRGENFLYPYYTYTALVLSFCLLFQVLILQEKQAVLP